ncbi:hypothetical protein L195_g043500 [Trifolium pratense]|uniref:Uncharacterized protein n=1 Tax=Trifolium pratense TaxID=57577 RepID=A0A2K3M9E9_TRIPR|nr:hypothetical protein L195_g043500 [Trifolium pratense]
MVGCGVAAMEQVNPVDHFLQHGGVAAIVKIIENISWDWIMVQKNIKKSVSDRNASPLTCIHSSWDSDLCCCIGEILLVLRIGASTTLSDMCSFYGNLVLPIVVVLSM